jgi:hypothetical protein
MLRIAWSRLAILALGLSLASCLDDDKACPTCPPDNSARVVVQVSGQGLVDSVHVALDGGASVAAYRDERVIIGGLARGTHDVAIVRWIQTGGISAPRSSSFQIQLEQGETRLIVFHNDFPLIAESLPTAPGRADRTRLQGAAGDPRDHGCA